MKITVNYTIEDMFNGKHIISATKEKAEYIDICELISQMTKMDEPTNYVVHVELADISNLKAVMFWYETYKDRDDRILSVNYLFESNALDNYLKPVNEVKKFFREYLRDEEACQIEK